MITQLRLTAAEMAAVYGASPALTHPAVPARTAHLLPVNSPPAARLRLHGGHVMFDHGGSMSRNRHVKPPVRYGAALKLLEPTHRRSGTFIADAVRRAWESGEVTPHLRPGAYTTARTARVTVYVTSLRLLRLSDLTPADAARLGLRAVPGGVTFRADHRAPHPDAASALADLHDAQRPAYLAQERPYVWLIEWTEPVIHETAGQTWREVTAAVDDLAGLDVRIAALRAQLDPLTSQRRALEQHILRHVRAQQTDESATLHVGGYAVTRFTVRRAQP